MTGQKGGGERERNRGRGEGGGKGGRRMREERTGMDELASELGKEAGASVEPRNSQARAVPSRIPSSH